MPATHTINFTSESLFPGSGWDGATAQPDPVGDSGALGYSRKPIARWDVVRYQTFSGTLNVGVVADHVNADGIAYVKFAVDGGPWKTVSSASANPDTENTTGIGVDDDATGLGVYASGVVEYWATLDASMLEDGPIEVRAVVYPVNGVPRVLDSLILNANGGDTLTVIDQWVDSVSGNDTTGDGTIGNPWLTIGKAANELSGETFTDANIYCKAGTYIAPSTSFPHPNTTTGYITIQPAVGVARASVIIATKQLIDDVYYGIYCDHIRWKNVTVQPTTVANLSGIFSAKANALFWLDGCVLIGKGRFVYPITTWESADLGALFMTDCDVSACTEPPLSSTEMLSRNVSVDDTAGGGGANIGNNALIINYRVTGTNSTGYLPDEVHSHVLQTFGDTPGDIIFYGVSADPVLEGIGFLTGNAATVTDMLWLKCNLNSVAGIPVFYPSGPAVNFLVKDSTFVGQSVWNDLFTAVDVVVDNVTFSSSPGAHAGVTYR